MKISKEEIERYLEDVKNAVKNKKYRLDRNKNRSDNNSLFYNYVINNEMAENIILDLTVMDFAERVYNKHKGYEHELLYIFGKNVELIERFGSREKTVSLYIKFNKLENNFVIVISFHKQKYPIKYYFK